MSRLVLHVLPYDLARGAQRYARELRSRLDTPEIRHRILTIFASPSRELGADVALDVPLAFAQRFGFDPRAALALARELRKSTPDLVVAHGGAPLKYLAAISRREPPVVYYKIGIAHSAALRHGRRLMHQALLTRASRVAGVSQECLDEAEQSFGVPRSHLVLIPNGRDEKHFHPGAGHDDERPRLIFVGHLTASKRPERFIELVRRLRRSGVELSASMVGDGTLRASLTQAAREAQVELLGHSDDVPALLRAADLLAFTSIPDGEGMPGVFIEAGLSGLPVVSTDVPGAGTVIANGETGFVVGVDDLDAFVDRAKLLLEDAELRRRFGAAARLRCLAGFTLDASVARWQDLLTGLLPLPSTQDATITPGST
jgi:glycosyltransferase involved in cell wall biosynthesis